MNQPEEVSVQVRQGDWWLVDGDEHTSWRGNFFKTKNELIAAEIERYRSSNKYNDEMIKRLEKLKS